MATGVRRGWPDVSMSGRSRNRSKAKWTVWGFRSLRRGSSCSTPKRGGAPCHTGMMNGSASNSPSLTQRRKDQTKLEISRCAAELFVLRGENPVTADDIAHEAGIGLRTFYRYFRTKEDAVRPILANGIDEWLRSIASSSPGTPVVQVLESAARVALNSPAATPDAIALIRQLQRIIPGDPALQNVWLSLVNDTETALVLVLRELMGPGADPLEVRLLAIAANTAQRMAVAAWVDGESPAYGDGSPAEVAVRCIRILTAGLGHMST
ncbi:transcriptional regulator, TetR family [Rhodococcus erythropolis SK121]|nr:transcriptional regulator, TetR family [Rhodococcus erythropolis SK121]